MNSWFLAYRNRYGCVCVCVNLCPRVYIHLLPDSYQWRGHRKNDILVAIRTLITQILVLNVILHKKEPGAQAKYKVRLEHLIVQKNMKFSKNHGDIFKGMRTSWKGTYWLNLGQFDYQNE